MTFTASSGSTVVPITWVLQNAPAGVTMSGSGNSRTIHVASNAAAGTATVRVSTAGTIVNRTVTVGAVQAPQISVQPQPQNITVGQTARFSVVATGANRTYQWQARAPGGTWRNFTNSGNVSGADRRELVISNVIMLDNNHEIRVIVSNTGGSDISGAVLLTVNPLPPYPQVNRSGRMVRIQSSHGRFLNATSATNINQVVYNATSGNQMWYIEHVWGPYHRISNQGVRSPNLGATDHALAAATETTLRLNSATIANNQLWAIHHTGTEYIFVNRAHPGMRIRVDSMTAVPRLGTQAAGSYWGTRAIEMNSFLLPGRHIRNAPASPTVSNPLRINFIVQANARPDWMPFELYRQAAQAWNNVDNRIIIGAFQANQTTGINVRITGIHHEIDPNTNAVILGTAFTTSNATEVWGQRVEINNNPSIFNGIWANDTDRRMNIIHEMGHVLLLEHPLDVNNRTVVSVMNQGLPSSTNSTQVASFPMGYDRATLRNRWR